MNYGSETVVRTTSHRCNALGGLASSWQTLLSKQRADVMATVLKLWHRIRNLTPSVDVYLIKEQTAKFHPDLFIVAFTQYA